MSDNDAARILPLLPIEGYISRFVSLKKRGRNFLGLCPFHHEKTPSFTVSPEKGIFKCFGCGKGGNLFNFVQEYERLNFYEALKLLANQAGIKLKPQAGKYSQIKKEENDDLENLAEWVNQTYYAQIETEIPQSYLKKRKIKSKIQKIFSIGFAPSQYRFLETNLQKSFQPKEQENYLQKLYQLGLIIKDTRDGGNSYNQFHGRLIFPIHNEQGKTIAMGGRTLEDKPHTAKYINSTDSKLFHKKNSLYNIHRAKSSIRENNMAILVEGYFDVIGLYQKDIKNVVAPLGTAFTNEQAKILRRFTNNIVIFFDSDNAGKEATFKTLIVAQKNNIQVKVVQHFDNLKDPFEISIEKDEIDILAMIDSAKNQVSFILWYYFFHKYTISNLEDKKKAISDFFLYLKENIDQLWEQLDFIKQASLTLEITHEVLQYDFKRFLKASHNIQLSPIKDKRKSDNFKSTTLKIPRIEKDILAILLHSPKYWSNKLLLEHINWTTQEIHLLFSYFHDRLKIGKTWEWNMLNQIILDLPKELSSLLSTIIIEFDQVLENTPEKKDYTSTLKKMILQKKRNEIEIKIGELQKKLSLNNEFVNKDMNELTLQFQNLIEEKKKTTDAIHHS